MWKRSNTCSSIMLLEKEGYYETYTYWVRILFQGCLLVNGSQNYFCYHLIYIHILKNRDLANSHFNTVIFFLLFTTPVWITVLQARMILSPCEADGFPFIKGEQWCGSISASSQAYIKLEIMAPLCLNYWSHFSRGKRMILGGVIYAFLR